MASQMLTSVAPTARLAPGAQRPSLVARPQPRRCAPLAAGPRMPLAACRAQAKSASQKEAAEERSSVSSAVVGEEVPAGEDGFASSGFMEKTVLMLAATATPLLLAPEMSWAKGGEFGILEGRTAALVHPAVMFTLFAASLYAGYLGYQWRRVREVGNQITELKKTIPEGAAGEGSPVAAEVAKLTEERKVLVAGGYRDKHWLAGSWLLAAGVGIAIEGCANTYMRTGRLFPGPHLYAGAIITVLWAAAAALVPAMQKGNETARTAHIALNVANVLLFVSQIPTGLEIVGKVFEFTVWP